MYTSESGEWKLGGFEVLSSIKDDDAVIYVSESATTLQTPMANALVDVRKPGARHGPLYAT